jgi:phenylpropionate dioxygenase-like ring-hydroxylating dioxygenase large terminal subunit
VEKPGDYFTFEIAGQSLFCIRGRDGVIARLLQCLPAPRA